MDCMHYMCSGETWSAPINPHSQQLWGQDPQSSLRKLPSLCRPMLLRKNIIEYIQVNCSSLWIYPLAVTTHLFWALACYEQLHSFSAAAADLIFYKSALSQMIRFQTPQQKGADLLYPQACPPSNKWDYWSGYYQATQLIPASLPPLSWPGIPGVLWLCIVAESLYLTLLFMGGALMILELCPCFSIMNKLKLSAFAAMCTALSGITDQTREEKIWLCAPM